MSKQAIQAANKVWKQLIEEAEATSDGMFMLYATVGDVSLISFVLGCALGMEMGLERNVDKKEGETDVVLDG